MVVYLFYPSMSPEQFGLFCKTYLEDKRGPPKGSERSVKNIIMTWEET